MSPLEAGVHLDQAEGAMVQALRAIGCEEGAAVARIGALLRAAHHAAHVAATAPKGDGLDEARDALALVVLAHCEACSLGAQGRAWSLLGDARGHLRRAVESLAPSSPAPVPAPVPAPFPAPLPGLAAPAAPGRSPVFAPVPVPVLTPPPVPAAVIPPDPNRVVWRKELQRLTGKSSDTIRRWIADGRIPPPTVELNRLTVGWRASDLRAAGVPA